MTTQESLEEITFEVANTRGFLDVSEVIYLDEDSRRCLRSDYEKIVEIANENIWIPCFHKSYGPYECAAEYVFLLRIREKVVSAFVFDLKIPPLIFGEGFIEEEFPYGDIFEISCLGTNPEYQKKGYGTLALEEAKRFARSKGAKILQLNVDYGKTDLVSFYSKRGFVLESENDYEYTLKCTL